MARKIVSDMVRWKMYLIGVVAEEPQHLQYSLTDMMKANERIRLENEKVKHAEGGRRTIRVTLDDRAIAALYVAMNYEPSDIPVTAATTVRLGAPIAEDAGIDSIISTKSI